MSPLFFMTGEAFRHWFLNNHDKKQELWVGFYKKKSGRPSITWPESVDEALCFGWIDGIRKSVDDNSYMIRFTPRKSGSIWSNKNISRYEELKKAGLIHPSGQRTFENRNIQRSGVYSFEQQEINFNDNYLKEFKKNKKAWDFFQSQVPSYRRPAIHWVMSAKKEETRQKRFNMLISDSASGKKIKPLRRNE